MTINAFLAASLLMVPAAGDPISLTRDSSEAHAALLILDKEATGAPVADADWRALFATVPYRWLQAREAAVDRAFTDEDFKTFLRSPDAIANRIQWRATLKAAEAADMKMIGRRALAWLPDGALINTRVFMEIKPRKNSFVWRNKEEGLAIFLYLEPQSTAKFENTVAHECHHIGLESLSPQQEAAVAGTPEAVRRAIHWMSAFGEGEAMLAAAGSVDRHPHWEDDAAARARWDGDLAHFNADLGKIEALLTDILDGRLADDASIQKRAAPLWGDVQGAWYTVGYEMAVLVYLHDGKAGLDAALLDPRQLIARYNHIAEEANAKGADLALWSPSLLAKLKVLPARAVG